MHCVELRVAVKCEGCDRAIPLNGPLPRVKCHGCQEMLELKGRLRWSEVLNYQNPNRDVFTATRRDPPGHVRRGAWDPVNLTSRRAWPSCPDCERTFTQSETEESVDAGDSLTCPDCNATLPVTKPPSVLKRPFPAARWLIGAETRAPQKGLSVSTAFGGKPVAFACMACGGGLRVDGAARLVTCEYCEVPNYLPDDLWLALHPAPKRERWYVLFE